MDTYSRELGPACVAICDSCGVTIPGRDCMLHCEKSNLEDHNGGYDLCVKCGELRRKEEKRQQRTHLTRIKKATTQLNPLNNESKVTFIYIYLLTNILHNIYIDKRI